MAAEQTSEKKAPLPKVVTLSKALKLVSSASSAPASSSSLHSPVSPGKKAQTWVDKMNGTEPDKLNDKDFEGRPSGLGLGAKVAPNVKRTAPIDPVERRLLGKVNAQKRKSAEEEKRNTEEVNEASDDDSDEPQSRTIACSKKRNLPSVTSVPLRKKAK